MNLNERDGSVNKRSLHLHLQLATFTLRHFVRRARTVPV